MADPPPRFTMKTFGLLSLLSTVTARLSAPETDTYASSDEAKARIQAHIGDPETARKLIIGGTTANPLGRHPYYAILDVELPTPVGTPAQFFFCGAVLVNPSVALTSADCVDNFSSLALAVNYTNVSPDGGEQFRFATAAMLHPEYDANTNQNDLAALKLETPVTIPPISVGSSIVNNGAVTIMGMGLTDFSGTAPPPNFLQVGVVNVLARSQCRTAYGNRFLGARMICAQAPGVVSIDGVLIWHSVCDVCLFVWHLFLLPMPMTLKIRFDQ